MTLFLLFFVIGTL